MKQLLLLLLPLLLLTACNTAKLSTAIEQYEKGEYFEATQTLKQVYRKTDAREERETKGQVAWYMGLCFEKLMIPEQATSGYMNAQRYGWDDPSLLLRLARQQHRAGKYRDAEKSYLAHLVLYPDDEQAQTGLASCQQAAAWKEAGSRYEVKRFPLANSRRADFSPAIWGDKDDVLYWTSSNDKSTGDEKSPITGTKYCDVWSLRRDESGKWGRAQVVEGSLNSEADEGTPSFSPDGNTMYFSKAGGNDGPASPHIFASTRSDASWGKGTMLALTSDTISSLAHPAASPDGKWLYFVSDMPGGEGGLDIWRAPLRSNTDVGYIENLGPAINTPGDEMFPTFAPDGVLYFSTNGRETMGGLDIYSARLDEWDQWHLLHLGAPINSNGDDFGMTFCRSSLGTGVFPHSDSNVKEEQEGWFSSNRQQGKGYDNIFAFMLPSIKIKISGYVYDTEEEPVAEAIVRVVGRNGMNFKSLTKPDGSYEVSIDRSTEYVMMAGKQGFLNRKAEFTSDPDEEDADYEVDFYLPSISEPILIDNIFYDYNKARLREESYPALDDLVQLLEDNPYTAIELAAHTDRVGSQTYNLDLSQRRAESVVEYLISQGIDEGRLTPVGYGKERPKLVDEKLHEQYDFLPLGQLLDEDFVNALEPDQRAVADQINRRTEFQVTSTTWGIE